MKTTPPADTKILTVFRSRLDEAAREAYAALAPEIAELARGMPGFLSAKTFSAPDGERVTVVEFDNWEHHEAWSRHPRHLEAKRLGIQQFYLSYDISVCSVLAERHFER
jgi:heme-degrading monooxygenase HmoA